jgi:dolichol-phosphate mannosyltransferase
MKLICVLPTRDEAGNLDACAEALLGLRLDGVALTLQIVDDDSADGTGDVADVLARRHGARVQVLHRRNARGLGSALVAGFAAALGRGADLVAQLDADLSHDPQALPELVAQIASADLVIGSRYLAGGSIDPDWAWHRRALSRAANRLAVPALLGLPLTDATSGYRLWRAEALRRIDPSAHVASSGYGFQVEMCVLAHRLGLRIVEVPIHFADRGHGRSKMTLPVKLAAMRDILSLRWRQPVPEDEDRR